MQLEHSFTVPIGIDEAWGVLLDIERIAPCMPGAAIDSVDGDEFTGTVKVKLGPISLTYKGTAGFVEKDVANHRAVIVARGRDARGNGTAAATVAATLHEQDGSTAVAVQTDLDVTGRPAQFGRGVMVDVGNKLIGQFADCLARTLAEGGPAPAAAPETPTDELPAVDERAATLELPTAGTVAETAAASTGETAAADVPAKKAPPAKKATGKKAPPPKKTTAKKAPPAKKTTAKKAPPATKAPVEPEPVEQRPVEQAPAEMAPPAPVEAAVSEAAVSEPEAPVSESEAPVSVAPVSEAAEAPVTEPSLPAAAPQPTARHAAPAEVEPIDLLQSAGPAVAKRMAPVAVGAVLLVLIARRLRRR